MEFTQEHRQKIEKIIKTNPRFSGNEDLVDDFCSETFKRSFSIISSLDNINNVNAYLSKIASSAILSVLKDSGRLRQTKDGYKKIEHILTTAYSSDENGNIAFDIPDINDDFEEEIISQDEMNHIKNIILKLDKEKKEKRYFDLFQLRYIIGKKQSEISEDFGISQGEISRRLTELAQKINEYMK